MPIYEYQCQNKDCNHIFEEIQSINSIDLVECPKCHNPTLKKLIGTGSVIRFIGKGFYETDYKKKFPPSIEPPKEESTKKTEEKK